MKIAHLGSRTLRTRRSRAGKEKSGALEVAGTRAAAAALDKEDAEREQAMLDHVREQELGLLRQSTIFRAGCHRSFTTPLELRATCWYSLSA